MNIKEVFRDSGFFGLLCIPMCWFIGHNFGVGQQCIRCCEPKRKSDY